MSTKLHTKNNSNSDQLFIWVNLEEEIPQGDPVRLVDAIVESLDLKRFKKLYHECGRCAYHPKMMLKIILYAYLDNTYSCRKIEELLRYDIRFKWLAAQESPDFITINRFRNRVKNEIGNIFTLIVLKLAEKGFISLDVEYVDGTKVESKANKYTFVWRKSVEKNREKLQEKLRILLQQIDEVIVQEKAAEGGKADITTEELTTVIEELKASMPAEPETKDEEQKKARREKEKQIKELEKRRDKLAEYDNQLKQIGDRNSMSKTDPDATFGQMKYDMAYRRFRHFGKDKVTMDFAFFAIAFNIKKMCAMMARRGKNGKNAPQNALFCLYIALTDDENRFLGNLRLKTAA